MILYRTSRWEEVWPAFLLREGRTWGVWRQSYFDGQRWYSAGTAQGFITTIIWILLPYMYVPMLNYMRYDVGNMGNHDVETGHAVYDRWVGQCDFPYTWGQYRGCVKESLIWNLMEVLERTGEGGSVREWLRRRYHPGFAWAVMGRTSFWRHGSMCGEMGEGKFRKRTTGYFDWTVSFRMDGKKLDNVVENGSKGVAANVPGFDVVLWDTTIPAGMKEWPMHRAILCW